MKPSRTVKPSSVSGECDMNVLGHILGIQLDGRGLGYCDSLCCLLRTQYEANMKRGIFQITPEQIEGAKTRADEIFSLGGY